MTRIFLIPKTACQNRRSVGLRKASCEIGSVLEDGLLEAMSVGDGKIEEFACVRIESFVTRYFGKSGRAFSKL